MRGKLKKYLTRVAILAASFLLALGILQLAEAGSLTPNAVPGGTMQSIQSVYDSLTGTFDSSSITSDAAGSAIEIARCAAARLTGGSCP